MRYELQEKPVTTAHEKLGKIEFQVEVPQATSLEEAKTMCGGEEELVTFVNSQIATNSKNTARAYARTYEVAKEVELTDELVEQLRAQIAEKGQELARSYSPSTDTERGPSKAKKAQKFDEIAALVSSGQDFTKEELLQLLNLSK